MRNVPNDLHDRSGSIYTMHEPPPPFGPAIRIVLLRFLIRYVRVKWKLFFYIFNRMCMSVRVCECVLQFNFESRALRYVRAAISLVNTEYIHCTISCHGIICIPFLFSGKTSFVICCIYSTQNSAHRSLYKWNCLHIDQLFF